MQIKTFCAASSASVLAQIKAELGPEAIILETRQEDGLVHMTAALERDPYAELPSSQDDDGYYADQGEWGDPGQSSRHFSSRFPEAQHVRLRRTEPRPTPVVAAPTAAPMVEATRPAGCEPYMPYAAAPSRERLYEEETSMFSSYSIPGKLQWQEEWSIIKSHLLTLMKPSLRLDLLQPRQRLALEFLQREGVEDEALLFLYDQLRDTPMANVLAPLSGLVPVRPWGQEHWPQRLHFVAGPYGAGKTSLAIRMALNLRRVSPDCRICLVNADAARGNGRLLLRHYCELSELAYKEASSTLELVAALNTAERQGFDRILVDLPGMGREGTLARLLADSGLAERCGEDEDSVAVHLALPPHYAGRELHAFLERYRTRHAGSLVWTKLDEAEQYGQIVNVGAASGLPVSSLSFGPGLGSSLVAAKEVLLWRLLFKRELPEPV